MLLTRLHRLHGNHVSPFHRMVAVQNELDSWFNQALTSSRRKESEVESAQGPENCVPALDLYENPDGLTLKLEAPGLEKEDIVISLEDGVLTVSGERKLEAGVEGTTVSRRERYTGAFERRIKLTTKVDAAQIKAAYTDGILTVTLPKSEEAKAKQIPIEIN